MKNKINHTLPDSLSAPAQPVLGCGTHAAELPQLQRQRHANRAAPSAKRHVFGPAAGKLQHRCPSLVEVLWLGGGGGHEKFNEHGGTPKWVFTGASYFVNG